MKKKFASSAIQTIALFVLLFFSIPSQAAKKAEFINTYSEHKTWLRLLHYKRKGNGWESEADHEAFFLSRDGKQNPRKELLALIEALEGDYEDVICRFPARTAWTISQLGLSEFGEFTCPKLEEWRSGFGKRQLSISLVSPYVTSPASIMGHTFLTFSGSTPSQKGLLSSSVNYAADTSTANESYRYIWNGLTGGFPGLIEKRPMFRRLRRYNENEGRDVWEYPLAFSPSEIEFIIDHLWEIKGDSFNYYFLNENCAYRVLTVLAIAKPELISVEGFSHLAIPLDTLKLIDNAGLIKSVTYWPSAERKLAQAISQYPKDQQILIRDIAKNKVSARAVDVIEKKTTRGEILQLSHRYLSHLIQDRRINPHTARQRIHLLNEEISALPPVKISYETPSENPLLSHESQRLSLSYVTNESSNMFDLEFRLAGHSFIDPSYGQPKDMSAEYIKIVLRGTENDNMQLHKLDFIDINSRPTFSSLFRRKSWGVRLGIERKNTDVRTEELTAVLSGNLGVTTKFLGNTVSFLGLFEGNIHKRQDEHFTADAGAALSIRKNLAFANYIIDLEHKKNTHFREMNHSAARISLSKYLGKYGSIVSTVESTHYEDDTSRTYSLGYRIYF